MQIKKILIFFFFAVVFSSTGMGDAAPTHSGYKYQLYKNFENFGILVFPEDRIFAGLGKYIQKNRIQSCGDWASRNEVWA